MVKNTVVKMPSENVTSIESRTNGIGPGDRLQAARLEMDLSLEDVANQMHLSVNILKSIEDNNFEDITAPIFVKGYLRSYARIVSLGEEDMIQQYTKFYSEEDPPINSTSNTLTEISFEDSRVKWTTYIVILVLCGLLSAWWWNKNQDRSDVVSLDVDQSTITSPESVNDNPVVIQPIVTVSSEAVVESDSAPTETVEVVDTIEQQTVESDQTSLISNSETVVEIEPVEPAAVAETTSAISEIDSSSMDNSATERQSAATGSDVIKLIVNADTWADIKDSTGEGLVYDLLHAGRRLTLTGQAPFTVFFGNGHGIEMSYNGDEVDVSSRIRNDNTARLKIGNN